MNYGIGFIKVPKSNDEKFANFCMYFLKTILYNDTMSEFGYELEILGVYIWRL